jgi:hypothetical protein
MKDVPAEFPGSELVSAGLVDLAEGCESEASLLVSMAAPRLRALGFAVPASRQERPSHRLYELITERDGGVHGGAHSRYNALVARIVSFAHAAERDAASGLSIQPSSSS